MSRIGKKIVTIPKGVEIRWSGETIAVKGPKGTLTEKTAPGGEDRDHGRRADRGQDPRGEERRRGARVDAQSDGEHDHGRHRGFQKVLEIVGVGYRAQVQGAVLTLNVGYSNPVNYPVPKGIEVDASARARSPSRGSTSSWSARLRPRSGRSVRRSPTRARASSIPTSGSAARSARPAPRERMRA